MITTVSIACLLPGMTATCLTARQKDALYHSIQTHGILQPIVIRDTARGHEIIDGHWRYAIVKSLGQADIEAKNVGSITDEESAQLAIELNMNRGKPTSQGLVTLLETAIRGKVWLADVEKVLPFPGKIVVTLEKLQKKLAAKSSSGNAQSWINFNFHVDKGAARVCDDALTLVETSTGCTRHVAFERICADFLASGNNPGSQP